jgi:hypothetical protein
VLVGECFPTSFVSAFHEQRALVGERTVNSDFLCRLNGREESPGEFRIQNSELPLWDKRSSTGVWLLSRSCSTQHLIAVRSYKYTIAIGRSHYSATTAWTPPSSSSGIRPCSASAASASWLCANAACRLFRVLPLPSPHRT